MENELLNNLKKLVDENFSKKEYKKRFTVHVRQGIYFLDIGNISFFEANEGVVYAFDATGRKHLLSELTLKEIEDQLEPSEFFRINRCELVSKLYIEKIERVTKNGLAVKMKGNEIYLKTSQSNTAAFRSWIEK